MTATWIFLQFEDRSQRQMIRCLASQRGAVYPELHHGVRGPDPYAIEGKDGTSGRKRREMPGATEHRLNPPKRPPPDKPLV